MQIFILDINISKNAKFHCDKHIIKIPLEIAQMLSTTYHVLGYKKLPEYIFKRASYKNHPCSKWIRECKENFIYGCHLGLELYNEYQFRYNKPDKMQRIKKIFFYGIQHTPTELKRNIVLTPFAQAIPDDCKNFDAVTAYRNYYLKYKTHLFSWKNRKKPYWVIKEKVK